MENQVAHSRNPFEQDLPPRSSFTTKDPENLYLSSMNANELNFEAMRDGMLQVSGGTRSPPWEALTKDA